MALLPTLAILASMAAVDPPFDGTIFIDGDILVHTG